MKVQVLTGDKGSGSVIEEEDGSKTISITVPTIAGATGAKGDTGEKGEKGDPFTVVKTFASVKNMNGGFATDGVKEGQFVMISSNVEDADNAKLYVKGSTSYTFITDLSGSQGMKGEAATITIGTVTTGDKVSVTNSGDSNNAVLNFVLPKAKTTQQTVTLAAASWDSSAKTQRVAVTGLAADSIAMISIPDVATDAQITAIFDADITVTKQENGYVTFKYNGTKRTINLPIQVVILP